MENNSDKMLRDKLKAVELPFDPKAWEQMEMVLDEKKKRRGFFIWWLGAGMIFSAMFIGYAYLQNEAKNSKSLAEKRPAEITGGAEKIKKENIFPSQKAEENIPAPNFKNSAAPIKNNGANNVGAYLNQGKVKAKADKNKPALNEMTENKSPQSLENTVGNAKMRETPTDYLSAGKSVPQMAVSNLEIMSVDKLDEIQESGENKVKKEDDEDALLLRKTKNKIFHYSLGVIDNITGSTLGNQHPGGFYTVPSYAVGFTHDFTFIDRIAITNAVEFSQTSFKLNQPSAPDFYIAPSSYVSRITEIDIPVGIKGYIISKKKIRFYLQAGIINHIKLKETLQYSPDFSPALNYNNSPSASPGYASSTEFSVNKGKTYYASFYTSAGVEFIIKKHWVLFAEPLFYMSLQKIGIQDKTKYNLGLSNGFRYQF